MCIEAYRAVVLIIIHRFFYSVTDETIFVRIVKYIVIKKNRWNGDLRKGRNRKGWWQHSGAGAEDNPMGWSTNPWKASDIQSECCETGGGFVDSHARA